MKDEQLLKEDEQSDKPVREELRVTPFVECPNCCRLLEYGTEKCPQCYETIEEDYALLSAAIVVHNTQACSFANHVKHLDPAAFIVLAASAYAYVIDAYVSDLPIPIMMLLALAMPMVSLLAVLLWFFKFGQFAIGDEEYIRAKRDMQESLKMWVAILVVQFIALVTLWV